MSTDDETDLETRASNERSRDAMLLVRHADRTDAIRVAEGRELVLGRGGDADLVIDDSKASRAHATIRLRAGVLFVEDLGSRNGTRVNERVLRGEATVLRSGDRIFIGKAEIVATVPETRSATGDFFEGELAQMLAAKGPDLAVIRLGFPAPPSEELLDALDACVGAEGILVPRSDCELFALCADPDPAARAARLASEAHDAVVSIARYPADGRTAGELSRAAERSAGRSMAEAQDVVIADRGMHRVYDLARRVAPAPTTVLLLGETGVGKEIVARAIHELGPRSDGPFVTVNCGALPEALLESELFGHEKGAFTGADRAKVGLFEAASGGTIFLDEIGEMTLGAQVRLLRVLETRRLTRLGTVTEVLLDVRVLCATHRDLAARVSAGEFREDLYYRIATSVIRIPPLRERPLEVPLLARAFADGAASRMGSEPPSIDAGVLDALRAYAWPGNVRELRNAMEHAVAMAAGGTIGAEHLPEAVLGTATRAAAAPVKDRVAEAEAQAIREALAKTGGNRTHAATLLGVSRRTLIYKLARYGIR